MQFVFLKIILVLLIFSPILHAADEELCARSAIESVCSSVDSAKTAMDCYKGAKGKYAGVQCESECKEKLLYCIDNEKINLKTTFAD